MPIIIVYTQNINNVTSNKMNEYIKKQGINISFVKVLAEELEMMNSNKIINTFGDKDLINETLQQCTLALKGNLINLMTQVISNNIKDKIKKINLLIEENINTSIIKHFIQEYKCVLSDQEFKNFIVNLMGKNIFSFYINHNKKISNNSLNLLKNSNILNSVDILIKNNKRIVEDFINTKIDELSKIFLDKQAILEKESFNIRLDNKRDLNGFKKTVETFFKRNFNFISQKCIINHIIRKIFWKFFKNYRKQLDLITESLLKKNNDIEINNYLEDCFLTKLEKFSKDFKINIKIFYKNKEISEKEEIQNEPLKNEDIEENSFDLIDNFNNINEEKLVNNIKENKENWYPLKQKKWIHLNEDSTNNLIYFLENDMIYQDSYFIKEHFDTVYNSLRNYEKNDLINIFDFVKKKFLIEKINKSFSTSHIYCNKLLISQITSSEQFKDIFMNKINKEIEKINLDKDFCKIDYLSIIITGKSGVGKRTLINAMLKNIVVEDHIRHEMNYKYYKSDIIPFLRFFNICGEIIGNQMFLKNIQNFIDNQNKIIGNNSNCNICDYIQCIWYCIKSYEKEEFEIIKKLYKTQNSLPIIIVLTLSIDKKKVDTIYNLVREQFKDIPFIPILAKPFGEILDSYGLNDLLNITLKLCKNTLKGRIFEKIREKSFEKIENYFKKRNKSIKINASNNIVNTFINNYNRVLNNDELYKFIFDLFKSIFIEYIKSDEVKEEIELSEENKNLLKNITNIQSFILNFVEYYKKNTEKIVEPILENKAIEYLDAQVIKEKKENKSINIINKCNKVDFINIIRTFLNDNIYYN